MQRYEITPESVGNLLDYGFNVNVNVKTLWGKKKHSMILRAASVYVIRATE